MTCHCLIRHALTEAEKKQAKEALRYARSVKDPTGILIALAALQTCPKAKKR